MKQRQIKEMCMTAVFAALICVFAPVSVPVGTLVPVTLATLAIYIAAGLLDVKCSTAAVTVYILLGAVGLPVFSGFTGGFQKLAGVTGGYIIGYIPLAVIISYLCGKIHKKWIFPVSMLAGTIVLYAVGTAWFTVSAHTTLSAALMTCVVKFIPGDIAKIAAASILCIELRQRISGFVHSEKNME